MTAGWTGKEVETLAARWREKKVGYFASEMHRKENREIGYGMETKEKKKEFGGGMEKKKRKTLTAEWRG